MTTEALAKFRAHYLWVDAVVTGASVPEVGVVEHKIASPWPATHRVDAHIVPSESAAERWDISINSMIDGSAETLVGLDGLHAGESIYRAIHRDVMAASRADGWTRLHAALVDSGGVRVAVAGHSGAGKTTLALSLALRGAQLYADEGVFIRGADAVGLPRRIHIKAGTFDVLPKIKRYHPLHLGYEPPVWALDPTTLPTPPESACAVKGIDILLILDGRAGDSTVVEPMPTALAVQSLAEQASLWSDDYGLTLRNISALLSATPCYRLTRHHSDSGIDAVEELLASCATRSI